MNKAVLALATLMFSSAFALAPLVLPGSLPALFASPAWAAPPALTHSVAIDGFSVSYPDGWSTLRSGQLTMILNVPADQQATLGPQFIFTPQVSISTEQRLDDSDALRQLDEIAAGGGPSSNTVPAMVPVDAGSSGVAGPRAGAPESAREQEKTISDASASSPRSLISLRPGAPPRHTGDTARTPPTYAR